MAYADAVDGEIIARTDFIEKDLIRQIPGANYLGDRLWHMPLSWGSCQTLMGVFGQRLQVGPALTDWANEYFTMRVQPVMGLRNAVGYTERLDERLLVFQEPGHDFLILGQDVLLGDEPGTGKTVQVRAAVQKLDRLGYNPYPALCIVPNSAKRRPWLEWWTKWPDDVQTIVIPSGGAAKKREKLLAEAEQRTIDGEKIVVVIHWEAVILHSRLAPYGSIRLRKCTEHGGEDPTVKISRCEVHPKELNRIPWRTVVVDEAHRMVNPSAKQTRAIWSVQHGPTVKWRWSLTGTPIANDPSDLWSIMHGIAPYDYPTKTAFTDRFCMLAWTAFGDLSVVGVHPAHRDEFFAILDPHFRCMPKALVQPYLPPKVRNRRDAEMKPAQVKAYREIESGMVTRLDDGSVVLTTNNLTKNTRLLQFSSSYAEVIDDGSVRLAEPSSKLDVLDEIIDEEARTKPLVICAESRQLIMLAAARLDKRKKPIPYRMIVGGMTDDQRDASMLDFQEGRARIMLFTIKAGGVSITLTAADTIIFLQRSWSMLENKQAEDRVHREGSQQHSSIHIIDIVAPGTVEEDQIARLYEKMARLEEITRHRKTLLEAGMQYEAQALQAEEQLILGSDLSGLYLQGAPA